MTPIQELNELAAADKRAKYPNVPPSYIPATKYRDKDANGLTKCILDYLRMKGHQAERVSNTGRLVDTRQQYTDVIGRLRQIGTVKWIKGTGTNGTADISATIKGLSIKIEVKVGKDVQSQDQKAYQASIEAAGGIYWTVKSFADFYNKYSDLA